MILDKETNNLQKPTDNIEYLKESSLHLVLYGAAELAKQVKFILDLHNIEIDFVTVDKKYWREGIRFLDFEILPMEDVLAKNLEANVILAFISDDMTEKIERLNKNANVRKCMFFKPHNLLPIDLLNDVLVEQTRWSKKQPTGYNEIDFSDIEFFEENILANIENFLTGKVEGTNYNKIEMSYKQRAFLNGIIRKTKPKTIVEIGVSAGGGSCLILNAIRDRKGAKLYSFDYSAAWYRAGQNDGRKTGFWVEQILPELMPKWELYTGGAPCKYFDKHLPKDGVDICFIDTMHCNPGEHLNILEIMPFMKKNSIVVYHDTAYHLTDAAATTNRVSINTLKGKRIFLKSENTTGLPNIEGIILDEDIENMLFALFSNLSLPWDYKITNYDFVETLKHFSKYYSRDLLRLYVYSCCFYMNGGHQNKEEAKEIAEKETAAFKDIK